MTTCKIEHSAPAEELWIPEYLCRVCHPELNLSAEQRAVLDQRDREKARELYDQQKRDRELNKAKQSLASIEKHGEPWPGSVAAKIAASLRKKIERMEGP